MKYRRDIDVDNKSIVMLEDTPINKLIWKLSIPSFIGIISYNLYNIINTIYISRGIGAYAAGGLAVTFPLFIFLSAISSTMGAGAASVISRALGENNIEKAGRAAANTFVVFWGIALLITILGLIFLSTILFVMGVTDKLLPYANEYTRVVLIGAVTSTGFSSLIRAEGSSKYAMYQWIIPVAANMILDPILIFAVHLGVTGAAVATVLSQCISVAMFVYYYFLSSKTQLKIRLKYFIPDFRIIVEICSIGMPSFIQMASQSFTIIIINNVLRKYGGDLYISTYGIVNKITVFLIIPVQGILQGIQPIIGYNYGAGKKQRVMQTLKYSGKLTGYYGIICYILIVIFTKFVLYPFTSKLDIINIGTGMLKIICIGLAFSGTQMILVSYFQAIGKSTISFVLSLCNYVLCFVPVLLIFSILGGLKLIWYAFPASNIVSFGITYLCIVHRFREEET